MGLGSLNNQPRKPFIGLSASLFITATGSNEHRLSFLLTRSAERKGNMATEIQTDVISVQISAYASRLADYVISKFVSDKTVQHIAAGNVLLLINNEFIPVSQLAGDLAFNAGGGCIYELYVANYRSAVRSYKKVLGSTEYEALYAFASFDGEFDITDEAISIAVREASYDLYGDLEEML